MPEKETPAAEPQPISNEEALAKAGAFFLTVEKYLVGKIEEAASLGTHAEFSSLRGALSTTLAHFRTAKPGGHD